jgi:Domain of unknown function (DUF4383)
MVMVKLYARMTGLILLLVGLMGFLMNDFMGLIQFDVVHNTFHLLIAVVALYIGFGTDDTRLSHLFGEVMGFVFAVLGLVGFINPTFFGLLGPLHLEPVENLLHLVLGLWGIGVTLGIGKTHLVHD